MKTALTELSDQELMQRYCQGEEAAFAQLYERHQLALFRFIRRLLGNDLEAQCDEVFQDCWMRIISARDVFRNDAGATWKTWAFTIAHNLTMDRLRRSGRQVSIQTLLVEGNQAGETDGARDGDSGLSWIQTHATAQTPGLEDQSHWRAAGKQLLSCIQALPEVQRAAFLMHHEEGISLEEIAAQTQQGFETIKSRLRYALAKLRTCMHAYLAPGWSS